jgi:hypothetical protein
VVNVAFAYDFLFNFFPIFKGMWRVNDNKMLNACFCGTLWVAIPYVLVGFLGCAVAFYPPGTSTKVHEIFLLCLNLDNTSKPAFIIINVSYIFSTCIAIILNFFGCRNNVINIVNIWRKRGERPRSGAEPTEMEPLIVA